MSTARKAKNKAKRQAIHASNDAERAPEDRVANRDFDVLAMPQLSQLRLQWYNTIREWFDEYSEAVLHKPAGDSDKYFKGRANSEVMTIQMIRQFLFWLADSRYGRLPHSDGSTTTKSSVTRVTMVGYCELLFGALRYFGRLLELEVRQQVMWWLKSDLVRDKNLNLATRAKPIAYARDVTHILRCLFQPLTLCSMSCPRMVWYLCLFINLAIDSCGRIGEIVENAYPGQYLSWSDCEFWVHQEPERRKVFSAIIKFTWLKGKRLKPSEYKKITFRLLPIQLTYEDTLRQLLLLGLAEGHFDGVDSWDDLERLEASPTGSILAVKQVSLKLPVLRTASWRGNDTVDVSLPMRASYVTVKLAELGILAGFREKLTSYCFRRGIAYTLHQSTNAENRRFLMGHNSSSKVYSEYQSRVSTIDFQAITRNLEPATDVHHMGGIGLGRRDNAPTVLSVAGFDDVQKDLELRNLDDHLVEASDACRVVHSTIQNAKIANDRLCKDYLRLSMARGSRFKELATLKFREEYHEFMQRQIFATLPVKINCEETSHLRDSGGSILASSEETAEEIDADDLMPDDQDDFPLDPELLQDQLIAESSVLLEDLKKQIEAIQELLDSTASTNPEPNTIDIVDFASVRVHDIHEESRKKILPGSTRKVLPRNMLFAHIYAQVTGGDLSDSEIAKLLIPFIQVINPLDRFPPSFMPQPGTLACSTCGSLHVISGDSGPFKKHYACYAARALEQAKQTWANLVTQFPFPCSWSYRNHPTKSCDKQFDVVGNAQHQAHLYSHIRSVDRTSKKFCCRFDPCRKESTTFDSVEERSEHLLQEHSYIPWATAECLFKWCPYCEDFVFLTADSAERAAHFAQHLTDAHEDVLHYGYNGIEIGHRVIVPPVCIFCFHNSSVVAEERLRICAPHADASAKLKYHHLEHIQDLEPGMRVFCPASAASGTDLALCLSSERMAPEALKLHLRDVRAIDAVEFAAYSKLLQKNKDKRAADRAESEAVPEEAREAEFSDTRAARQPLKDLFTNKKLKTQAKSSASSSKATNFAREDDYFAA